jgi:hypothetical protein
MQEVKIKGTVVQSQHTEKVHETPSQPAAGCGDELLPFQLCERLTLGGLQLQARKSHKTPSQQKNLSGWFVLDWGKKERE